MTGPRLVALTTRALGRKPNPLELDDWRQTLQHIHDDDADQALTQHRASSPHPPTPSDVRKHATGIANDRADRQTIERRRRELETGIAAEGDHAGQPLHPMPPEFREQLADLAQRRQVPTAQPFDPERLEQARAELAARGPLPMPGEHPASTS